MKMFFHTFKVVYVLQAKRWDAKGQIQLETMS